ncbi:hypothetical protein TorRG33x02_145470 [Trema orientale]|uniref:Uncharacterized protein n=1 Tax=Trema orientale TaxID=63057 RepID=A0A2P5EW01_TREOI|nr:hypothetical protein TorRG33x02_145470 [Trema orientale]
MAANVSKRARLFGIIIRTILLETIMAWNTLNPIKVTTSIKYQRIVFWRCTNENVHEVLTGPESDAGLQSGDELARKPASVGLRRGGRRHNWANLLLWLLPGFLL